MDRFIDHLQDYAWVVFDDLKSNMDRFIASTKIAITMPSIFKIQYG